ncbi:ComEA family DNA-binding protein [Huintestinicola sp.]
MKSSEKDINRLVLAAVLIIASAAVLITGGLIADKKSVDMPAVEIIEAEDKAVTAEDNLAETVNTDDTIIVTGEVSAEVVEDTSASTAIVEEQAAGLININTADAAELMKLKGVGEKTAEKIIEYRVQTPFEKPEDIMNVKGIGEKKFEDIKDHICV